MFEEGMYLTNEDFQRELNLELTWNAMGYIDRDEKKYSPCTGE